jgi:hypothetical protein
MQVIRADVSTSVSNIFVPATPQRTTCDTSGTATDTLPNTTTISSTTNCTTTPGTPPQVVPISRQTADVRVIIDNQKLVIECSSGWRRCVTLNPGLYQVDYSFKKDAWKDVWVHGSDTVSGKQLKVKYHVVAQW